MSVFISFAPDDHYLYPETKNHSFDIKSKQQNIPQMHSAGSFNVFRMREIKNLL